MEKHKSKGTQKEEQIPTVRKPRHSPLKARLAILSSREWLCEFKKNKNKAGTAKTKTTTTTTEEHVLNMCRNISKCSLVGIIPESSWVKLLERLWSDLLFVTSVAALLSLGRRGRRRAGVGSSEATIWSASTEWSTTTNYCTVPRRRQHKQYWEQTGQHNSRTTEERIRKPARFPPFSCVKGIVRHSQLKFHLFNTQPDFHGGCDDIS